MRTRARLGRLGPALLLLRLAVPAEPHAAITRPAMRHNARVAGGWCPWCQGAQQFCEVGSPSCLPPSPCWDADPGTRVARERFSGMQGLKTPEGDFWVDEGGPDPPAPVLCAGDAVPVHFVIFADHNGAYRWEAQQADPGEESEAAFRNFTPWTSLNNDVATEYYRKDGATPHETDRCNNRSTAWSWSLEGCRQNSWARTWVRLPDGMPPGRHVLRWLWLGGLTTWGQRVVGPEPAVFVNCVDVVIGEEQRCPSARPAAAEPPTAVPEPPAPAPAQPSAADDDDLADAAADADDLANASGPQRSAPPAPAPLSAEWAAGSRAPHAPALPAATPMPARAPAAVSAAGARGTAGASAAASGPPLAECSAAWDQCGGKAWTGPTCCTDGSYCATYGNEYYHQCRPDMQPGAEGPLMGESTLARSWRSPTEPYAGPLVWLVASLASLSAAVLIRWSRDLCGDAAFRACPILPAE